MTAGPLQIAIMLFGFGLEIVLIGLLAELIVSRTTVGTTYAVLEMRRPQRQGVFFIDKAGPVHDRPADS